MWQFPDVELLPDAGDAQRSLCEHVSLGTGVAVEVGAQRDSIRHQVTRHRIELLVFDCRAVSGRARALRYDAVRWCHPRDLLDLAMPAAHRRIARLVS
jgi:hypothetical protein